MRPGGGGSTGCALFPPLNGAVLQYRSHKDPGRVAVFAAPNHSMTHKLSVCRVQLGSAALYSSRCVQ